MNNKRFRDNVICRIESEFQDSIVFWDSSGCPDDEYDDTESFNALWIPDVDYKRFTEFIWNLRDNFAEPNGYSLIVHAFNETQTKRYYWMEYQEQLQIRRTWKPHTTKVGCYIKRVEMDGSSVNGTKFDEQELVKEAGFGRLDSKGSSSWCNGGKETYKGKSDNLALNLPKAA